jgi:four helix bundle protein
MINSQKPVNHPLDICDRTFKFSLRIINLVKSLPKNYIGSAIGHQIIRSGTSIGANVEEAQNASSKKDFINGLVIALKEARETHYWLRIIESSDLIDRNLLPSILSENKELILILAKIILNLKKNLK